MFDILPSRFSLSIRCLDSSKLNELRLRVGEPAVIYYNGWKMLGKAGLSYGEEDRLVPIYDEVQDIVYRACECSVYAHNDELRNGFVTYKGVRIGLAGDVVMEDSRVVTIKNFSSLVIRFPHDIENCSVGALPYLTQVNRMLSTLVVSPPGCGKTTFIRDLIRQIVARHVVENVLIVDERREIATMEAGVSPLKLKNVDVLSGATKEGGLRSGIRSLAPQVAVIDEIMSDSDYQALTYATGCGVTLIATIHSRDFKTLTCKPSFSKYLANLFERVVVLSDRLGVGTLEQVCSIDGVILFNGEK